VGHVFYLQERELSKWVWARARREIPLADGGHRPQYTPIGLAHCSQVNLILATDAIMKLVGGETRRVVHVHEDALAQVYPHRVTRHGLKIIELVLAEGSMQSRGGGL
jgi:hypothetical protein